MSSQHPGWYTDPLDAGRVRWWDGQQWGDHTHDLQPGAGAITATNAGAPHPGEPALAPPPSTRGGQSLRPTTPGMRPSQDWGDVSALPPVRTEPSAAPSADPRTGRSVVPRIGLALVAVLVVAGSVGVWSWWSAGRDEDEASAGPPASSAEPDPAANDGIPSFIDQPWMRTAPPGGVVDFEFPGTHDTGARTGPDGLSVTTLVAGDEGGGGVGGSVTCSVFADPIAATTTLDQSAVAAAVLAEAGIPEQIAQFIETPVGPATRFAGNDTQRGIAVRGVVVGNGAETTWCLVTLPNTQSTLADLTLQRIVSTFARV